MNRLNYILVLTILLLSPACEYEPGGNNFMELTPPEDYIPVEILLNDVNPSDTIYVYQNTTISVKIKTPKDLLQASVFMDEKIYANLRSNSLSFEINPIQFSEGTHQMTVNAVFTSGTGSLAEMMGLERYEGDLSWTVRVIDDGQDLMELGYRINEDGFLEIFWDSPINENVVEKYTVHPGSTQETDTTIKDATQKSFVDYGYVCGDANYKVKTYLKDGYSFSKNLSVNTPTPTVKFENVGLDKLRVYWDKPLANGRYSLMVDNAWIASGIHDTTITLPQIFGEIRHFTLEIRPQKAEYDNYKNKFTSWDNFCQGTSLELPNWPMFAYNMTDNIIYTSRYNSLVAYDAASLEGINTVRIIGNPLGLLYGGKIASAPHNSTVAAMTGEETWIFGDSHFVDPIVIPSLPGGIHIRLAALTNNDRFFVVQGGSNHCKIFNTLTGEKILEFLFMYTTQTDLTDYVSVSDNGQFFCASSLNGMEVFEISGATTNLIYTDTRFYKGAMFVPSQPDKLLLRVGKNIELRQLPEFNLIQTLDVSVNGAILCNIDPANMSLLYYQNDSLKVCKINNLSETIFKIRSDDFICKMFNNKLLSHNGGISFDINPYISH